jgi:tetratricopeptide (TPR) repeat protein
MGTILCQTGSENFADSRSKYDTALPEQKKQLTLEMNNAYDELLKGIQRLEEAIRRFPNDDRNFTCLYQVAESYRSAAEWPKLKLTEVASSTVDLRENYRKDRDELLNQSLAAYVRLRESLTQDGESVVVDPIRRKLMENSFFGEADLLYEMQEYEKAIGVYRSASNRFLSQPAALEALTRVGQCLQQLGRNGEATRVINQAMDLINRIDDSNPKVFEETTRGSKKEWTAYLNWLKSNMR